MRPFHVSTSDGEVIFRVDEDGEVIFRVDEDGKVFMRPGLKVEESVHYAVDALNQQRAIINEQHELIQLLQSNRWQEAVLHGAPVYDALTPAARKAISTRMVSQVLDAVAIVAKKSIN